MKTNNKNNNQYNILSLDGGGIRGLISAIIIERLNDETNFLEYIDLTAGTSTGGLIALAIAKGIEPSRITSIYLEDGPFIFDDTWLDDVQDLGCLLGARYDNKNLEGILRTLFCNTKLGDLKKKVLITAFDLDNQLSGMRRWKPKLFHNFNGDGSDKEMSAYKAGLSTAAAPTYFPSYEGFIDGGVFAVNPALCAYCQVKDKRYFENPLTDDQIFILSIGTGVNLNFIKGERLDWGYAQWMQPLISLMMDGVSGIADYECRQILNDNYFRVEPVFPAGVNIPMDGIKMIPYMKEFALKLDLTEAVNWINKYIVVK